MAHTPAIDVNQYRVQNRRRIDLADWSTDDNGGMAKRDPAVGLLFDELNGRLEELQELLYADGRHKLLVVIQATDTGGKDGTIRHVFDGVNPQGVRVASFKRPTDDELAHDYLWRVHRHTPRNGEIVIFNRSHYEDVLVVRVHGLVSGKQWQRRYGHIRDFERLLTDEGTTIVKFFLHISKDEQKERLQARLDEPEKHWKFDVADLKERNHWDDYQTAFADMLAETGTSDAPWYVVPADRKWYRNLVISTVLVDTLAALDLRFPDAEAGLDAIEIN
ncbi:MAG: polyphosphate kinase 2 family protein [Acidimicrobiia bacterium]|nr:polyphosphate kinase 2 family protein [Acidimicrobiia bacterium]